MEPQGITSFIEVGETPEALGPYRREGKSAASDIDKPEMTLGTRKKEAVRFAHPGTQWLSVDFRGSSLSEAAGLGGTLSGADREMVPC